MIIGDNGGNIDIPEWDMVQFKTYVEDTRWGVKQGASGGHERPRNSHGDIPLVSETVTMGVSESVVLW